MNAIYNNQLLFRSILFEVFFLVPILIGLIRFGGYTTDYWILYYIVKISLGIIVFLLLISAKRKSNIIGIVSIVSMLLVMLIINIVQPKIAEFIGGPFIIFLSVNALFIYRYYRNPEISERLPERLKKQNILILGMLFLSGIMLLTSYHGIFETGMMFAWIAFITEGEGIIRPTVEDISQ